MKPDVGDHRMGMFEGSRTPSNRPESSRTPTNLASREDSRRRTRSKNNEEWSVPEEEPEMPLANVATSLSFGPRGEGRMKTEGLRNTAMGFGFSTELSEGPAVPSTPGGFQSEGGRSIDGLGVAPTKSTVSKVRSKMSVAHQDDDGFEAMNFVEPEPGHWDLNRSGVIPVSVFVGLWTACACGVLFAMVYIYRFQEVLKSYQLAEESALAHARLVAADLLLPTVGAVDAIQASLAGGILSDLSDYGTVLRILRPHFESRKILEEVELAVPPNASGISPGSVLLKRIGHEVKLLTDRDDCEEVPGRRGCTQTLSARTDDWYRDGFGIDKAWTYVPPEQFWSGPLFIRVDKDLTVCPQLCWKPAFMFVKRATITGGPKAVISGIATNDQPATSSTLNTVLVRVVVSAEIFQEVVDTAVSLSLGEAIVATASGDVVAAKDMSSAVLIDEETGNLQVNKVWEAKNRWAGAASEDMVSRGQQGIYAESGAYSVSVRRLEGPNDDALDLGSTLRLVLGTPIFAFMDPLLFTLTWPACGVSAAPIAVLVTGVVWAFLRRRRKKQESSRVGSAGNRQSSMLTSSNSGLGEAPSRAQSNSRLTQREKFAMTGHGRTHLENRRTSLTEALGLRDVRKRLTARQKTIELSQVDEPAEAPQDMVQMAETT
eukprot:s1701_g13.t1